ncbi:MAG: substrate-binding domain-containing protein [Thermodesulfobacteriota bacterium]
MAKGLTMTRRIQLLIGILLLIASPAKGAAAPLAGEPSDRKLIVAGPGSSTAVMQRIADSFQRRRQSDVSFHVIPGIGSTGVIKAVTAGRIDIGLSPRPLTAEERGQGLIETPYGRTPFVFAVQESNPTVSMTLTEIEALYAGLREVWPDGRRVRPILRPVHADASLFLAGISPRLKSAYEKAHSIPGVRISMTDGEAKENIEKTPGAFGTIYASCLVMEPRGIKALAIDGVAPAPTNLADGVNISAGRYPYAVTMSMVYKRDHRTERVTDFIRFVFSKDGTKILSESGYMAVPPLAGK